MAEPATTAAFLSVTKVWSIIASVCGSIIPVMALSDKNKISLKNAIFMSATGSSFAIFVGPWIAMYFGLVSIEAVVALSWTMGLVGVYLVRAVLTWLDKKGVTAVDRLFTKATGISTDQSEPTGMKEQRSPVEVERLNRDDAGG